MTMQALLGHSEALTPKNPVQCLEKLRSRPVNARLMRLMAERIGLADPKGRQRGPIRERGIAVWAGA